MQNYGKVTLTRLGYLTRMSGGGSGGRGCKCGLRGLRGLHGLLKGLHEVEYKLDGFWSLDTAFLLNIN